MPSVGRRGNITPLGQLSRACLTHERQTERERERQTVSRLVLDSQARKSFRPTVWLAASGFRCRGAAVDRGCLAAVFRNRLVRSHGISEISPKSTLYANRCPEFFILLVSGTGTLPNGYVPMMAMSSVANLGLHKSSNSEASPTSPPGYMEMAPLSSSLPKSGEYLIVIRRKSLEEQQQQQSHQQQLGDQLPAKNDEGDDGSCLVYMEWLNSPGARRSSTPLCSSSRRSSRRPSLTPRNASPYPVNY